MQNNRKIIENQSIFFDHDLSKLKCPWPTIPVGALGPNNFNVHGKLRLSLK